MNGDPLADPRLVAHLAAVTRALGDQPGAETVLEHLRAHIREAATAQGGDVAAVLASLDPPEAYVVAGAAPAGARLGWWAFLAALAGPLLGLLVGLLSPGDGTHLGWLAFTAVELSAAAAGTAAWRRPWGRTAVLTAGALFAVPLLLAALFP